MICLLAPAVHADGGSRARMGMPRGMAWIALIFIGCSLPSRSVVERPRRPRAQYADRLQRLRPDPGEETGPVVDVEDPAGEPVPHAFLGARLVVVAVVAV